MCTISGLTRDGTAEHISRNQILRRERGQGKKNNFCCSADHEQNWQPYTRLFYTLLKVMTIHIYTQMRPPLKKLAVKKFSLKLFEKKKIDHKNRCRGVSLFIFSLAFLDIYIKNLAIRTGAGFGGANKPRASRKIRVS